MADGLAWCASRQSQRPSPANERFRNEATLAVDAAGKTLFCTGEVLKAKAAVLGLKPNQIKEEFARTGRVACRQSRELPEQAADAAVDSATTVAVKARVAADSEFSVWSIGVSTTAGRLTLDGTVDSEDQIACAITLALEIDGAAQVNADLKVKSPQSLGKETIGPSFPKCGKCTLHQIVLTEHSRGLNLPETVNRYAGQTRKIKTPVRRLGPPKTTPGPCSQNPSKRLATFARRKT